LAGSVRPVFGERSCLVESAVIEPFLPLSLHPLSIRFDAELSVLLCFDQFAHFTCDTLALAIHRELVI
jgi:hypothetical protein